MNARTHLSEFAWLAIILAVLAWSWIGAYDPGVWVMEVLPVFIAKQNLDTYAAELVREAEITGRVGSETNTRAAVLSERLGIEPDITWSRTGRIQLNEEVTVTLSLDVDIGLFGGLGSFPIELTAQATGKSEVYWK